MADRGRPPRAIPGVERIAAPPTPSFVIDAAVHPVLPDREPSVALVIDDPDLSGVYTRAVRPGPTGWLLEALFAFASEVYNADEKHVAAYGHQDPAACREFALMWGSVGIPASVLAVS